MTQEEVLERARQFVAEGRMVLPADDPERGMRGFLAFTVDDEGEEASEILEWPLFQGPLEPEKAEVGPEELAQFVAAPGPVALCDDPRQLCIGFVRYEPEEGRSVVRQTRLRLVKGADDDTRAAIMGIRDHLMANPLQVTLNP